MEDLQTRCRDGKVKVVIASQVYGGNPDNAALEIEHLTRFGARVRIQSQVYLTAYSVVEDDVFIGPASATTNETAFLTYKVVRGLGVLPFDNQARV